MAKTLTVRELMDLLSLYDRDLPVYCDKDNDLLAIDVCYEATKPRVYIKVLYPNVIIGGW
jgi:hypothetical protein